MGISINIYNESSLHNTLKTYYAVSRDGNTEIKLDGYIYDVVTKDNQVYEIQTKNLSKLLPKIMTALENGRKITVVHPIIISKKIFLYDEDGKTLLSKRKSPRKETLYSIFDELTGIYPVLLNKNFTLELLEINMIEERKKACEPIQSKNNRRRFKRDWIKTNKRLEEIISTRHFKTEKDYLSLLPASLPKEFCAKDLSAAFRLEQTFPPEAAKKAHLIIWVYSRMGIIEYLENRNRNRYYKTSFGNHPV